MRFKSPRAPAGEQISSLGTSLDLYLQVLWLFLFCSFFSQLSWIFQRLGCCTGEHVGTGNLILSNAGFLQGERKSSQRLLQAYGACLQINDPLLSSSFALMISACLFPTTDSTALGISKHSPTKCFLLSSVALLFISGVSILKTKLFFLVNWRFQPALLRDF